MTFPQGCMKSCIFLTDRSVPCAFRYCASAEDTSNLFKKRKMRETHSRDATVTTLGNHHIYSSNFIKVFANERVLRCACAVTEVAIGWLDASSASRHVVLRLLTRTRTFRYLERVPRVSCVLVGSRPQRVDPRNHVSPHGGGREVAHELFRGMLALGPRRHSFEPTTVS